MYRLISFCVLSLFLLSACEPTPTVGPDGQPAQRVYRIGPGQASDVQFRLLDSVNSLRQAAGAAPVQFNAQLNAAAATHSKDMARQNRPWHFGSDGSSPLERAQRVGYRGQIRGEVISETFETELQTLAAWMEQADTRAVILDRTANELGFAWHQERSGKLWWTLVMGQSGFQAAGGLPGAGRF